MSDKNNKDDNDFPSKWLKKLPVEFVDAINTMDENDIKKRVLTCEGNIYEIENAKANDQKLNSAKELLKECSQPYNESKAIEACKIKYCLFVLESRGINLN
jgi:hypothetical protein